MRKFNKNKNKLKPKFQLGTQDMQSEQQANALVSGVGAINPIIGAGLKLGQGIGKMTQDENGMYGSRAGAFIDNSFNPTTGIQNLKDLGKDFSASTLANQMSLGLFGTSATQKRRKKAMQNAENQANASWIRNSAPTSPTLPTFKTGGVMDSKPAVLHGGEMKTISPTAVQVKADNPMQTDSVELPTAFVDHNEVIDNQDRVFSDVIKAPTGKSVAKEAAKLEKMKSASSRFELANQHIDERLDNLFDYQESLKPKFANGGRIPKPKKAIGGTIDPAKPSGRKLPKDVVTAYVQDSGNTGTPLAKIEDSDPIFYDSKAFNKFYRDKTIGLLDPESKTVFEGFSSPADQDAWIAAKGGMPNFEIYQKHLRAYEKANIKDGNTLARVAASSPPTVGGGGYQYNRGQGRPAKESITKPRFATGGPFDDALVPGSTKLDLTGNIYKDQTAWGTPLLSEAPTSVSTDSSLPPSQKKGVNWGQVGTTAATYLPDLINLGLTSRLKKPAAPRLETRVNLDRISADSQLADNARQAANTTAAVRALTAQPANAAASMGSILAKRLYADNAVRNQVNNTNAEIAAREAGINTGIAARNADRQNMANMANTEFNNRKLSAYSQIASNVGEKFLQQRREKKLENLSNAELQVLQTKYKDSGIYDRNFDTIIEEYKARQAGKKVKKRLGGRMKNC